MSACVERSETGEVGELSLKRSPMCLAYPPISPHRPSLIAKLKAISTDSELEFDAIYRRARSGTFVSSGDYVRFMDAPSAYRPFFIAHSPRNSSSTFFWKGGWERGRQGGRGEGELERLRKNVESVAANRPLPRDGSLNLRETSGNHTATPLFRDNGHVIKKISCIIYIIITKNSLFSYLRIPFGGVSVPRFALVSRSSKVTR